MLELLIAILIALGCNVDRTLTAEELRAQHSQAFAKAETIYQSGQYERTADGGVVVSTVVGD